MREGTAYIDHISGRWEAYHNAEGRKWPLGLYGSREDAIQYCKKKRFARIVDCTACGEHGHMILGRAMG